MRVLIDTSMLVEAEREMFDLGGWIEVHAEEVFICDAGVAEYLAGEPVKDGGKRKRFKDFWASTVSQIPSLDLGRDVCERAGRLLALARTKGITVSLGDGLHGAVAEMGGLTVLTRDESHFKAMQVPVVNPLKAIST